MEMEDQKFDELVNEVWEKIPQEFKDQIENLSILIELEPTGQQLSRMKVKGILLGLFQGVPKTAYGQVFSGIQPAKITIFRNNILRVCKDEKELKVRVHVVLMHEIAHYFGYNDDDMFVMDKKMRERLSKEN